MVSTDEAGGAVVLPLQQDRVKDTIKRIHEYVWARHIDGSDRYDHSIDDEEAIGLLDAHYSEIGNRNSPDQVYLGVLLFERAFEEPERQAECFERARKIFEFYRRVTGEDDWPAVEDRLEDIAAFFEEGDDATEPQEAEAPATIEVAPPPPVAVPEAEVEVEPPPVVPPVEDLESAPVAAEAEAPVVEEETEEDEESAVAEPEEAAAEGEAVRAETASAAEEEQRRHQEKAAARREAAEAFIADLKVVEGMQLVPAGTFLFGANGREIFLDSYYIDRLPITNGEYMRFVRETGYREPRYMNDERRNQPLQPVVGISLRDAQQYARWAGKELPSEIQWEKAARGTDGRPFPWGNDPPGSSDACFGLDPVDGAPAPVGQALRNVSPFGVQDVAGNVWEWTTSNFAKESEYKVVRGGSYNDPAEFLALDIRLEAHPKDKCEAIGFRCVKNIHP
jgi:formylglycine-generating enzyme required for sulfatase activity